MPHPTMDADEIRRRFPQADPSLESDLAACEEASLNEKIEPRAALKMIQTLHRHRQQLAEATRSGRNFGEDAVNESRSNERPS